MNINWKPHITALCAKLRRADSALSKICYYVPPNILLTVYYMPCLTHIYDMLVKFGVKTKTTIRCVYNLQKCAVRLISFSFFRSSSAPIFKYLQVIPIFNLVKLLNIILMNQHLNSILPQDLCNTLSFNKIDHTYPTQSKSKGLLKMPVVSTST